MRQATQSSSRPPASVSPMISQQLGGDRGEAHAQHGRADHAPEDDPGPVLGRQAGHGQADDDGVVARHHQVDQHDLDEGEDEPVTEAQSFHVRTPGP